MHIGFIAAFDKRNSRADSFVNAAAIRTTLFFRHLIYEFRNDHYHYVLIGNPIYL